MGNDQENDTTMAERATLQIKDAQGVPDMVLVLTDRPALVLRGAEILERQLEQAEQAAIGVMADSNLVTRLIRYLLMRQAEETERAIERLAGGVPLEEVEEIGLDSSGFKIRLKGHGHPLINLDANAVDWLEACMFVQQVDEARNQEAR